jgi:CRP-like cAMP-binding protein
MGSVFNDWPEEDLAKIKSLGNEVAFDAQQKIFSEGDEADFLYFLQSGKVSLYIDKFNTRDEIRLVEAGDWFGEMAMFNGNRRNASALTLEPTVFLAVARSDFTRLMDSEPAMREAIVASVHQRNMDLVLREKLIDTECMRRKDFHYSIKGDPSLRESALHRERYESVVDRHLPALVARLEDLLLNRVVHRVMIGFNNGEIRISTLLDPFAEEFHPALRLLDDSYVERHFPTIDFAEKVEFIGKIYRAIQDSRALSGLHKSIKDGMETYFSNWQPLSKPDIQAILSQLESLRQIPNFYVRSLTLSILKDAIHMQFNCDGTHIVSTSGYKRFIAENL